MDLTVADGPQRVVLLHALTHDPPAREDGVGADGVGVEGAARAHQIIRADVTHAAADGEVPVRQREARISQHVLRETRSQSLSPDLHPDGFMSSRSDT